LSGSIELTLLYTTLDILCTQTTALYEAVCRKVREVVPQFQPTQVIAHFEEALAAAVRAVFGNNLTVSECWFHFTQALVKRMCANWAW